MPRLWRIVREGIRKLKKRDKEREREGVRRNLKTYGKNRFNFFVEIKSYLGFCR